MQHEIEFTAGDGVTLPGVLTTPDDATGPVPGLVMIYEAFGMTDEMRRVARDLADDGYAVLIPDLFARGPVRPICVASAIRTTIRGTGRELDDIEAARRRLADDPAVDGERIGAIGFCMGGSFALLLAKTGLYKVSAPFYSMPVEMDRACPVVASFGGRDLANRGFAERLTTDLEALGVAHDVQIYPEAGHSFYTRTPGLMGRVLPYTPIRGEYHEASAADAHRRIVAFFREHLDA
ncbi:dienelactone hydrolase family protein [Pseudonocardia sp. TRM90224]|uniref:dienelactone hydrolase family protein n=1 Tax=Pseudonocardia sp. TRM90224 TaxID=2812678 RepID=UPI001E2EBD1B|nr:dienelactone hydrolase family protein [Pseudonocardia sp. TRM90224]